MATTPEDIKKLKQTIAEAKAEMDRLLGSADALQRQAIKTTDAYKRQATIIKESNEQVRELLSIQKQSVDALIEQEGKLKGLSGLQASLVSLDRERIFLQDGVDASLINTHESLNSIASLNQELLSMSAEDVIGRKQIKKSIIGQINDLKGMEGVTAEIVKNLQAQFKKAKGVASLTEKQQVFLNKQLAVYESIQDAIGMVLDTASLLISTKEGIFGASLIGAGKFVGKLGEVRSQLGGIAEFGTTAISFIDPNAVENAKELASQFGGIDNLSGSLQVSTSLISANMGISGIEAAGLLGSFSRLNGNSEDTALNLTKATQQFAKQNGVIPSAVMQDLASATEEFALYGKEGGKNLIEAATYARKLGTNLKTVTAIGDSLLDFETSITKELEASAILGRNINLNKARGLFYAGKEKEAMDEVLRVVGGLDEFNKMDRFSKRAVTDLLGIQADTLQTMLANQEKAADMSGTLAGNFNKAGEFLQAGLNKYLGVTVEGLGGALIAIGQMGTGLKQVGQTTKSVFGGLSKLFKYTKTVDDTLDSTKDLVNDSVQNKLSDELKDRAQKKSKDIVDPNNITKSIPKINAKSLLQGAAAMLVMAGAVFVMAKALQEMKDVGLTELGMAASSLVVLGLALWGLSALLAPLVTTGILELVALGILAFGVAIAAVGFGVKLAAEGFSIFATSLVLLANNILPLLGMIGGLGILSLAFIGLSAALATLSNPLSMAGLGVLAGVSALAGGTLLVMKELGIIGDDSSESSSGIDNPTTMDSGYQKSMLSKMDMLIELSKTDRNIYIDGEKITTIISKNNNKITRNEGVNLYTN